MKQELEVSIPFFMKLVCGRIVKTRRFKTNKMRLVTWVKHLECKKTLCRKLNLLSQMDYV